MEEKKILVADDMEKKLRESEKWQAATLNSIGDAVIATDEKGIIKLINPFAEALTGWCKDDSVGKPLNVIFNIINEKTSAKAKNPVIKVRQEGAFFGLSENTALITRDGMEIPVEIIVTPVLDDWNKIIGIIIVFYDILEREKIEREFVFGNYWKNMGSRICRSSIPQRKLIDFFIENPKTAINAHQDRRIGCTSVIG